MSVESGSGSTTDVRTVAGGTVAGGTAAGGTAAGGTASVPRGASQETLAYLYETYVAYLYDYCEGVLRSTAAAAEAVKDTLLTATAQIGELPDPDRLREWLYSIARLQCLSRPRRAAATASGGTAEEPAGAWGAGIADSGIAYTSTADTGTVDVGSADTGPVYTRATNAATTDADTANIEIPDIEAAAFEWETLQAARAALDGLTDRDREVLNLAFRHGFDGPEPAAILGVSPRSARTLLSGASARFERSAAVLAVLRADYGWAACTKLATIAGDWDPGAALAPRLGRRLARHIGSCEQCGESRAGRVFSPKMLGAVPLAVPPAAVRQQIMTSVFETDLGGYSAGPGGRLGRLTADGFPVQPKSGRGRQRLTAAAAVALVVLIAAGGLLYQHAAAPATDPGKPAADVATATPSVTPSPSPSAPKAAPGRPRASKAKRHVFAHRRARGQSPAPVGVLPAPVPAQTGGSPAPSPSGPSASPSPTSPSRSPSRSPSPSPTIPSGSPPPSPKTPSASST